jgi:hypothetical protein
MQLMSCAPGPDTLMLDEKVKGRLAMPGPGAVEIRDESTVRAKGESQQCGIEYRRDKIQIP